MSMRRRLVIVLVSVLIVMTAMLGVIEFQPALVANFADNFLRPVIGNRATIALEASMLSLSDHLKQIAYGTVEKPDANIFNKEPASAAALPKTALGKSKAATLAQKRALKLSPLNYFQPN